MLSQSDLRQPENSGNLFIDVLTHDWAFKPGTVITYVLQGAAGDTDPYGGSLWATDGRRAAFALALQAWSDVANIGFVESDIPFDGSGSRGAFDWVETLEPLGRNVLGQHDLPYAGPMEGNFNIDIGYFDGDSVQPGGLGFVTILHELGHGLGLLHPHDESGDGSFPGVSDAFDSGANGLNQGVFTVMTYLDGYEEVGLSRDASYGYSTGLGAIDIATVQFLYGANDSFNTGNDTYLLPQANVAGTGWASIWDAGGADTLSAAGSAIGAYIDLGAATLQNEYGGGGFVSRVAGILGGFTIANGVVIENALGGDGDDVIVGNSSDNILNGGNGFDLVDYSRFEGVVSIDLSTGGSTFAGNDTLIDIEGVRGGLSADSLTASDQTAEMFAPILFVRAGEYDEQRSGAEDAIDISAFFGEGLFASSLAPIASGDQLVATIAADGRQDFSDYYTFSVDSSASGTTIIIDIDASFDLDTVVNLYDGSGNLLASNDDMAGNLDPGSANFRDSYLVYTLPGSIGANFDLFIEVGAFNDRDGISAVASGSSYLLNVVAQAAVEAPAGAYHSLLDGGASRDTLTGGSGNDYLLGGYGKDQIDGRDGDDWILGGADDDTIYGGAGNDTIWGGGGRNYLDGQAGNDTLVGGGARDTLVANGGIDTLDGGEGGDFYVIMDSGAHILFDTGTGLDPDWIFNHVDYVLTTDTIENIEMQDVATARMATGNDIANSIRGNSYDNTLVGLGGDDHLVGYGGNDTLFGDDGNDNMFGNEGDDTLFGGAGDDKLDGRENNDILVGGSGNDIIEGGTHLDTAVMSGNRSQYTITQTSTGVFEVVGLDGTDTLTEVEFLQFDDELMRLLPGTGVAVNFETADPSVYQAALEGLRDFDGNALGGDGFWLRIGSADIDGDGDVDQILVNDAIGRFATVGGTDDGLSYFDDHGWAGETRVVGIYIDPLVASGDVVAGSDNDSQQRFQNDLFIENINRVLGADDYDGDGLQEVYFALTDGTAYLHAYMHADGNIQYANYQSEAQVIDYLESHGFGAETYGGWFA